ncbi:204aa long hypothetical protein [Pyrococcus horikoshii OT3]|uniref:Uncharacterized protein n=1 Tax=Pyrococcus horikoshii (strain ATCC 700860 / DSM 12428 / JCM 9974 / NBRC 100139 / OT-3) TaxID=70601 RepID=O59145_PYRHO|nr:204aa long hypothetical protein [Pyrococcus horikoshii OT3]
MVPMPVCSPWRAGLSNSISRAWLNKCSAPLAGLEEPAMLMATPLDIRALTTFLIPSSCPSLIISASRITIFALIKLSEAAYSLKYSPLSLCASFQSLTAVILLTISPTPAARYLFGAVFITSISAMTAIGGLAFIDVLTFKPLMDALALAIPSCDAVVGKLMNGIPILKLASFVTSIILPPPTAIAHLMPLSLILLITLSTSFM